MTFWNLRDENDYLLLLELNFASRQADHNKEPITLEAIADVLAHMDGLTPQEGVIIAALEDMPMGYSRLGWYSSRPETRLYYQFSFLRQEGRQGGLWPQMVANNERRLREIAASHPSVPDRYFPAWASDWQKGWMVVLESCGYRAVRRFNNLLFQLGEVPVKPMPDGLEIRPVRPEDMRAVWEAQKEMNDGLFENVAEDWLDEKYPGWLANPEHDPRYWQVAWESTPQGHGNPLAGMVLARIDERETKSASANTAIPSTSTSVQFGAGADWRAPCSRTVCRY